MKKSTSLYKALVLFLFFVLSSFSLLTKNISKDVTRKSNTTRIITVTYPNGLNWIKREKMRNHLIGKLNIKTVLSIELCFNPNKEIIEFISPSHTTFGNDDDDEDGEGGVDGGINGINNKLNDEAKSCGMSSAAFGIHCNPSGF
ncbi:hypothetical protein [Tenacibaculum amylolyticum]|uniref:hypothetical protein n=1 Tax=Tenacibaculum amylolyticum TaxID=104269 RepID=UPI0038942AF8